MQVTNTETEKVSLINTQSHGVWYHLGIVALTCNIVLTIIHGITTAYVATEFYSLPEHTFYMFSLTLTMGGEFSNVQNSCT